MLDAALPKLDRPPRAAGVDAAKAGDVDAVGLDPQRGGLMHRDVRTECVGTVRVHSPAILTCCSGPPAEENPARLLHVRWTGSCSAAHRRAKRVERHRS